MNIQPSALYFDLSVLINGEINRNLSFEELSFEELSEELIGNFLIGSDSELQEIVTSIDFNSHDFSKESGIVYQVSLC